MRRSGRLRVKHSYRLLKPLLTLARVTDALNGAVGRVVPWLVLAAVAVSALNALARYALGESSNAWLELQWYLFGAIVLLAAGDTLRHDGHVRIDVLHGRLGPRARAWVDLAGGLLVLLPFSLLMVALSWPGFVQSWQLGEISPDAGGLVRWPARLLLPAGFALLGLQAIAEVIRRVAQLRGEAPRRRVRRTAKQ